MKTIKSKKKKNIYRIISNRPQSLYEYLLLFPGACPCCGSRDWIKVFWKVDDLERELHSFENLQAYSQCLYCDYIKESFYGLESDRGVGRWYLEVGRKHYRVNSRYLSKEQEKLFPDWNWKPKITNEASDERSIVRAKPLFPGGNNGSQQIVGHS